MVYACAAKNTLEKQRGIWRCKHSDVKQKSEAARHLQKNPGHTFYWKILFKARNTFKRKIVEGLVIQGSNSSLNKWLKCFTAQLFPRGIIYVSGKQINFFGKRKEKKKKERKEKKRKKSEKIPRIINRKSRGKTSRKKKRNIVNKNLRRPQILLVMYLSRKCYLSSRLKQLKLKVSKSFSISFHISWPKYDIKFSKIRSKKNYKITNYVLHKIFCLWLIDRPGWCRPENDCCWYWLTFSECVWKSSSGLMLGTALIWWMGWAGCLAIVTFRDIMTQP